MGECEAAEERRDGKTHRNGGEARRSESTPAPPKRVHTTEAKTISSPTQREHASRKGPVTHTGGETSEDHAWRRLFLLHRRRA